MAQFERIETRIRSGLARVLAIRTGLWLVIAVVAAALFAWLALLSWLAVEAVSWLIHLL